MTYKINFIRIRIFITYKVMVTIEFMNIYFTIIVS